MRRLFVVSLCIYESYVCSHRINIFFSGIFSLRPSLLPSVPGCDVSCCVLFILLHSFCCRCFRTTKKCWLLLIEYLHLIIYVCIMYSIIYYSPHFSAGTADYVSIFQVVSACLYYAIWRWKYARECGSANEWMCIGTWLVAEHMHSDCLRWTAYLLLAHECRFADVVLVVVCSPQ